MHGTGRAKLEKCYGVMLVNISVVCKIVFLFLVVFLQRCIIGFVKSKIELLQKIVKGL